MRGIESLNEFVIKFANVNGSGSASANHLFAKAIFRMGLPVSPRNIFPSNIQGLPTWYEVRISEAGHLGRRGDGVDMMISVNPQSMTDDVMEVLPGGYFLYDSTRPLDLTLVREDVNFIGIPLTRITNEEYSDSRLRQLFKNVIYVGALAALLDMDFDIVKDLVADQFRGKEKLITPNIRALELGYAAATENFGCPIGLRLEKRDLLGDRVLMDGNTACGLGAVYGGATVAAWYPITPSTSVAEAYERYAGKLRTDPETGEHNYIVIQAEDELSAMGMVIGANWNGARAFTATSGPGLSLMNEFLGLAYFAEIPSVLIDVQRAGPSTGMPTRTQQSDVLPAAYASHGDTRHILLFPSDPAECFSLTAAAFDIADQLQTPVIMLTDLDLGMNDCVSPPMKWDDEREYRRGKVLNAEDLEEWEDFGRYVDRDGDGITYRTYPATHPEKGAFFTRGSSRTEQAVYTEKSEDYLANMQRLLRKWESAPRYLPEPVIQSGDSEFGVIHFGTSRHAVDESIENLGGQGYELDQLRLLAFPFHASVPKFIDQHEFIFVVEQNRDGQMRKLIMNELDIDPRKLVPILHYDGKPISADAVLEQIRKFLGDSKVSPIRTPRVS